MSRNPRLKCKSCRRWTIRRGTLRTPDVAYCPELARVCLSSAIEGGYIVGQIARRNKTRRQQAAEKHP